MTGQHRRPVNVRKRALVAASVVCLFSAGMSLSYSDLPPYEPAKRMPAPPYVPEWVPVLPAPPAPEDVSAPPPTRAQARIVQGPRVVPVVATSPSPGPERAPVLPLLAPAPPTSTPSPEPTKKPRGKRGERRCRKHPERPRCATPTPTPSPEG